MAKTQNHILTPSEWDETGQSAADTAQVVTHAPGAAQRSYVAGLFVQASDGGADAWNLDSPDGTLHVQGYAGNPSVVFDPPLEMPLGAAVRLEVAAGGVGITTRASIWGYDLDVPALPA